MADYFGPTLPCDYSPDGDPEYGPECPVCGRSMMVMRPYRGFPAYSCRCGYERETYWDAVDRAKIEALEAA